MHISVESEYLPGLSISKHTQSHLKLQEYRKHCCAMNLTVTKESIAQQCPGTYCLTWSGKAQCPSVFPIETEKESKRGREMEMDLRFGQQT